MACTPPPLDPVAGSGDGGSVSGTAIPPGVLSTSIEPLPVPRKAARDASSSAVAIAKGVEHLLRIGLYPDPGTWNVIQAPLP